MNESVNAAMSEYWNGEGAEKWLRLAGKMEPRLAPFGERAMAAANFSAGEAVLDIGFGCGNTTFEIGRRVGAAGRVLGVDISEPLLARAQAQMASAGQANVTFEYGDAQIHRFEADAFDAVFSRFGVMFFDDPAAAFGNIRRAMRPGGRVAFICWQPAKDNQWVGLSLDVAARHLPLPAPPGPEEPGPFSFGDPERVIRLLTGAGLADIEVERYEAPIAVGADRDEAVEFLIRMGPAGRAIAEAGADDATMARLEADLRDSLGPYETEHGIVLAAATWIVTARNP